jgi:hypothetical protein
VAADEIFILLLMVVCMGGLVAMEVHSRRKKRAADSAEAMTAEAPSVSEPSSTLPGPSKHADRHTRRQR